MAKRLLGMAESENVLAYVALQAINSALDRGGLVKPKQVEVTVRPFESLIADVEGGSRDAYRRSIENPRAGELLPGIDDTHRPGGPPRELTGVRVLGELPDGSLVLDGEPADDDQGDRSAGTEVTTAAMPRKPVGKPSRIRF